MAEDHPLDIQDCIVHDEHSAVYRVLHNGRSRCLRIWRELPSTVTLDRVQYVHSVEEDFPKSYELLNVNGQCGLLLQKMSGRSITSLQSSLSPKMVYEILAHVCHALHQSHMDLSSLEGVLLSPQGNIYIYTPSIPAQRQFNSVWLLGWWAIQHLSTADMKQARNLLLQGNVQEYQTYLKQSLRVLESGLPNQQWISSIVQSLENMCTPEIEHRWTAEAAARMMSAYAEQAIGLDIGQFCSTHTRLFDSVQFPKGPLSGQVHPSVTWKSRQTNTNFSTSIQHTIQQTWSTSNTRKPFILTACGVFFGLHSLTALGMQESSPDKSKTEIDTMVEVSIEHSGIRKLNLESGRMSGPQISLSRSKRTTSTALPTGQYKLSIKHMNALQSAFIEIDTDAKIACEHNANIVECTHNNRPIKLK